MIVTQELRIGNFIYHKDNPLPQKVDGLDPYKIQTEYISEYSKPEEFQPIPLTEELLKRIDWNGYNYLYFDGAFSLSVYGHLYYYSDYTGINVKFLHQLQNLYFALTGTELTIKL